MYLSLPCVCVALKNPWVYYFYLENYGNRYVTNNDSLNTKWVSSLIFDLIPFSFEKIVEIDDVWWGCSSVHVWVGKGSWVWKDKEEIGSLSGGDGCGYDACDRPLAMPAMALVWKIAVMVAAFDGLFGIK